jgi:dolichol-phosphate mannosyltransferase
VTGFRPLPNPEFGLRLPVAVVVPCYKVERQHISAVIEGLRGLVARIYVVDDCCPLRTGAYVRDTWPGEVVTVLFHQSNQGVGGAVITGYRQALADGHDIIVKMDGDNQMDPAHLPALVAPLLLGEADYTKGNRFFDIYALSTMPATRLVGNAALSFISKLASGYWHIMDPTNGYTAIHRTALAMLPVGRLQRRYFFESDMLFRLATIRAVVRDVPMPSIYGDETSNLRISRVLVQFPLLFLTRIIKRFFYSYLVRDFNVGSVQMLTGLALLGFGMLFGIWHWLVSVRSGHLASTGTVMVAVLPIIVGIQLLVSAVSYDIANRPETPLQRFALLAERLVRRDRTG